MDSPGVILARLVTVATCTPASLTQTSLSTSPVPPGSRSGWSVELCVDRAVASVSLLALPLSVMQTVD